MTVDAIVQWSAFSAFAFIAIAGALGMATTMSMFRSGVFLMASFVGVAGLFILLSADLLSLLQIMMYIGGMLVMILFMVLFSHDPGGAMMAGMMKLPPIERFFSLGLGAADHEGGHQSDEMQHGSSTGKHDATQNHHGESEQAQHTGRDESSEHREENREQDQPKHGGHENGMDMSEMSMTTPLKSYAALLAILAGVLLSALLLLRPAWQVSSKTPKPDSARQVGSLLMGKYMIAFEGAGLLILIGIFGAVFISRPGKFPDSGSRGGRVSVDAPPAPIDRAQLEPLAASAGNDGMDDVEVSEAHQDATSEGDRR